MKRKKKVVQQIVMVFSLLFALCSGLLIESSQVMARVMNVEKTGTLTVHKYLNPNVEPVEYCKEWEYDLNPDGSYKKDEQGALVTKYCKDHGEGFQGNGTTANGQNTSANGAVLTNNGPIPGAGANEGQGETKPLPGAEFTVYGRLTTTEANDLVLPGSDKPEGTGKKDPYNKDIYYNPEDPKPLDTTKVKAFMNTHEAYAVGVTNEKGIVEWKTLDGTTTKLPININTVDLADNLYLVVETKTPTSGPDGSPIVQQPSLPVIVNIPSTNPAVDKDGKEVDNYNYNVNIYMKNYFQTEPGIGKEIDKPSHAVGEEVKYKLSVTPLAFNISEFKELVVTDELDSRLNFYALGHTGGAAYLPLNAHNKGEKDTIETNKPVILPEDSVVFFQRAYDNGEASVDKEGNPKYNRIILTPNKDYYVSHPDQNTNGTIRWKFTQTGLQKLTGIREGDGSRIELYFTALTTAAVHANEIVPNGGTLDFQNKWGYGTKPGPNPPNPNYPPELPPGEPPFNPPPSDPGQPDPKKPTATKPTEIVNTIFGERYFEKRDKQNHTIKLEGAEFLVRNRSKRPVTALNGQGKMVTYPAGTTLYAILSNNQNGSNFPIEFTPDTAKDSIRPWMQHNQYVVGWTPNWKEAFDNHWTLTSDSKGQFHVQGLEYTNQVHYRKMYIFAEMEIVDVNGTRLELVKNYHYVLANKRSENTSEDEITKEINTILALHPGETSGPKAGNGAWKFYKESEANPSFKNYEHTDLIKDQATLDLSKTSNMIDYLGEEWNDYELIEVRAPEGYAPIEKNIAKYVNGAKDQLNPANNQDPKPDPDAGTVTEPGDYEPGGKDVFEHPLAFTVPGFNKDGEPLYNEGVYNDVIKDNPKCEDPSKNGSKDCDSLVNNSNNNVVPVPNGKMPKIPLTGGIGTLIFLVIGLTLIMIAFIIRKIRYKETVRK